MEALKSAQLIGRKAKIEHVRRVVCWPMVVIHCRNQQNKNNDESGIRTHAPEDQIYRTSNVLVLSLAP
jgi:hypothetical protein